MRLASIEGKRRWWNGGAAGLAIAAVAGLVAAALILWLIGDPMVAGGFVAAAIVLAGAGLALTHAHRSPRDSVSVGNDWELMRVMAEASPDGIAITDRGGRLMCANDQYEHLFAGFPTPPSLPLAGDGAGELEVAGRVAWRDGRARVTLRGSVGAIEATITRAGQQQDVLVWRFAGRTVAPGLPARLVEALDDALGAQLGAAGVMAALITAEGYVVSANAVLRARAAPSSEVSIIGEDLARFLAEDQGGTVRFVAEGAAANPLRLVQIPLADDPEAPILVALIDSDPGLGGSGDGIEALLMLMPFGVALIDREGRFLQMNSAFARAANVDAAAPPIYPGDLMVREDKSAVADAIRRFASSAARSTDLAVRLKDHPDEPVALSIAAARGLGDAAVLLSLKDNGEENRLKREVAQATKMQAVGQLAGGVAHDFNNILTAIIGHCDLMLMRHSPGDSDYDDIQQIRANSNRAASLTRQLLAFSRQQTLRPQVLQLPDVVSEVSNLLRRLMGETVTMEVKHGRDLGPVRADPGQLEQVVVNLAVNARDAMLSKGTGGKLTIQTRPVPIAEIRRRGDIVPPGDYTALEISDTGTGIPVDVLPKIFEPFFTTKEVGKGTGLGLSTVYGIVKQSGGFIFADSRPGLGATFTIYLPVHTAGVPDAVTVAAQAKQAARHRSGDLWGTGTILLVEDEDMVRAVAERALARQGYTVLAAENGEAAMELIQGVDRPTLVISDVMMPLMDGPTLARQLRKIHPDIPILFMSGYAEEQLRRSIDLDNVAFLPKPFSVQQLAEATRDVLVAEEAVKGAG